MMKNSVKLILVFVVLGVCVLVGAQGASLSDIPPSSSGLSTQNDNTCISNNSFCVKVTVDEAWIHDSGTLYIDTSGNESALKCAPFGDRYLQVNKSNENFKEFYTAILAGQLANKGVTFQVSGDNKSQLCNIISVVLVRGS